MYIYGRESKWIKLIELFNYFVPKYFFLMDVHFQIVFSVQRPKEVGESSWTGLKRDLETLEQCGTLRTEGLTLLRESCEPVYLYPLNTDWILPSFPCWAALSGVYFRMTSGCDSRVPCRRHLSLLSIFIVFYCVSPFPVHLYNHRLVGSNSYIVYQVLFLLRS